MEALFSALSKYRYLFLSAAVSALMLVQASHRSWKGDFWEHAAVVKELATHPFSPRHPLILSDAPHAFYSPYAVAAGWISRATGLDSFRILPALGAVNLVLLLTALWMFSAALLERREAAFYVLLFTLVLWGRGAWEFSGFFHLRALRYDFPYPSTFAGALALLALSLYCVILRTGKRLGYIPVALASLIILLTHPPTFIFFAVCIFSLTVGIPAARLPFREYAMILVCVFILPLIAAACWPYYPFVQLFRQGSSLYHPSNRAMYSEVLKHIWPALFGIPLVLWRIRSNRRDPVFMITAILGLIYAYGALSHHWTYGRVLSYIVLMLHISIADSVAQIETSLRRPALRFACVALVALVALAFLYRARGVLIECIRPYELSDYDRYKSLLGVTAQYDVVLSDLATSDYVPAFTGKVVAPLRPLPFVPDGDARRHDVTRFFSGSCPRAEREEIIRKYGVQWLLLSKENVPGWAAIAQSFREGAEIKLSNDLFLLMRLPRQSVARPPALSAVAAPP
jgi:hypothetical protein